MAESIGYITEALSLFDRSIKLVDEIRTHLTTHIKKLLLHDLDFSKMQLSLAVMIN